MADSLRSKTLNALTWHFIETAGLQGMRFVIGIVLARLLYPEQFGLIGMLTIFMAVAQTFLDGGFGVALVQKSETTQIDNCSIFYFNILVGIAAAGLLCLAAPWIADFYEQPILTPLTRALSLNIVINAFGMVQSSILTKQINFKVQTKASLIAGVLSGMIGIAFAVGGFGVWSLVVMQLAGTLVGTACLWYYSPWRPALMFSFESLRSMFGFGSKMLASGLLSQIFHNIYSLVIGKLFSATDLGFFTRAKTLVELPSQTLSLIVGRVIFPVFSSVQDDPDRVKRGMKKAMTTLVMIIFPCMIGLAIIARPFVLVLLTEKWADCILYLQLLSLAGMLYPLHLINVTILPALGRSDLYFQLEIIKNILTIINIAVCYRWGITALVYGIVLNSVISYYLNSYYTRKLVGYAVREQLRDVFAYLIMAVLMGIVVYMVSLLPFPNNLSLLLVQIGTGTVIYVSLCRLFRLAAFMELWQVGWNKMQLLKSGNT